MKLPKTTAKISSHYVTLKTDIKEVSTYNYISTYSNIAVHYETDSMGIYIQSGQHTKSKVSALFTHLFCQLYTLYNFN